MLLFFTFLLAPCFSLLASFGSGITAYSCFEFSFPIDNLGFNYIAIIKFIQSKIPQMFKHQIQHMRVRLAMLPNKKLLAFAGLSAYFGVYGLWIYNHPQALNSGLTKTLNSLSRMKVPKFARKSVYTWYASRYGVNLQEVEYPLAEYKCLNQFFTRRVGPRPICEKERVIVSPADGTVLSFTQITGNNTLIVKDIEYSLTQMLYQSNQRSEDIVKQLKLNQGSKLFQIILYLSPGDCHRFHSPANITVKATRDVEGKLRPVNIESLLKFRGLVYEENSRKILHTTYRFNEEPNQKYMGLAFIAALNVSDTEVESKRKFEKGQQMGRFNMGSTIVMVVETEGEVNWMCTTGKKLKYGEPLFQVNPKQ